MITISTVNHKEIFGHQLACWINRSNVRQKAQGQFCGEPLRFNAMQNQRHELLYLTPNPSGREIKCTCLYVRVCASSSSNSTAFLSGWAWAASMNSSCTHLSGMFPASRAPTPLHSFKTCEKHSCEYLLVYVYIYMRFVSIFLPSI